MGENSNQCSQELVLRTQGKQTRKSLRGWSKEDLVDWEPKDISQVEFMHAIFHTGMVPTCISNSNIVNELWLIYYT